MALIDVRPLADFVARIDDGKSNPNTVRFASFAYLVMS